jgi:hypothetical protein
VLWHPGSGGRNDRLYRKEKTQLYRKISDKISEVKLANTKERDVQASLSWIK